MCWALTNGNIGVGRLRPRGYERGSFRMAEQRVPNLEEMDEQEAHRFLRKLGIITKGTGK